MGQKEQGSSKIWPKLVTTWKWGSTQAFFGSKFTMTNIFRAKNNQSLNLLGNISIHLFLKFGCNYGHHHSKAKYKALAPWGGEFLFWILFILLLKSYSMGFSSAHRKPTHCETQNAVRVEVPVTSFLNEWETTPINYCLPAQDMTSVRSCHTKCSYSHKRWNCCLSTSCSELATIPSTLRNSCVGGNYLRQMHMSISLSE